MFDNKNQAFKEEFMMIQSSERRKDAMLYKNVNRKFLSFNLENHEQMVQVGLRLKPFGFFQHLQFKFIRSRFMLLRVWAETRIAKKGVKYIRNLYRENPSDFFDLHFNMEGSPIMELNQCKYIINDNSTQKTVSLLNPDALPDEMQKIRQSLLSKEKTMLDEQKLAEEFNPSEEDESDRASLAKFGLCPSMN